MQEAISVYVVGAVEKKRRQNLACAFRNARHLPKVAQKLKFSGTVFDGKMHCHTRSNLCPVPKHRDVVVSDLLLSAPAHAVGALNPAIFRPVA